jgi:hypothetical protein
MEGVRDRAADTVDYDPVVEAEQYLQQPETGLQYTRSDGTVEHASNIDEAARLCPVLGRMALENPELFEKMSEMIERTVKPEREQAEPVNEKQERPLPVLLDRKEKPLQVEVAKAEPEMYHRAEDAVEEIEESPADVHVAMVVEHETTEREIVRAAVESEAAEAVVVPDNPTRLNTLTIPEVKPMPIDHSEVELSVENTSRPDDTVALERVLPQDSKLEIPELQAVFTQVTEMGAPRRVDVPIEPVVSIEEMDEVLDRLLLEEALVVEQEYTLDATPEESDAEIMALPMVTEHVEHELPVLENYMPFSMDNVATDEPGVIPEQPEWNAKAEGLQELVEEINTLIEMMSVETTEITSIGDALEAKITALFEAMGHKEPGLTLNKVVVEHGVRKVMRELQQLCNGLKNLQPEVEDDWLADDEGLLEVTSGLGASGLADDDNKKRMLLAQRLGWRSLYQLVLVTRNLQAQ